MLRVFVATWYVINIVFGYHSSFVSKRHVSLGKKLTNRSSGMLKMLVEGSGKDALVSLTEESIVSSTVRNTPTKVRKLVSVATIPASAIMGFVMTPSRRLAANVLGAGLTSLIGSVSKSRIDASVLDAAEPALADLLLKNYESKFGDKGLLKQVSEIRENYNLSDEDYEVVSTKIYMKYLIAMCKNPIVKTSDINELTNLRSCLQLSEINVGEAHSDGAVELYRQTCLFTPEEELQDPYHPDRKRLDKFLYLSERAYQQNEETKEAFQYEMSRLCKAFKIASIQNALVRIQEVAEPFYQRALSSTRSKLESGSVNQQMLTRARTTLGISQHDANDMHLVAYSDEMKSLLHLQDESQVDNTFPNGANDRLKRLQDILGITQEDAEYELTVAVTPLFQQTVKSLLEQVVKNNSNKDVLKHIKSRQDELLLQDKAMIPLLSSVIVQMLGTPLESAEAFGRVKNEAQVYKELNKAIKIKQAFHEIFNASSKIELSTFFDATTTNSCNGFLSADERATLFEMFYSYQLKSNHQEGELNEIQQLLGMTDYDVEQASRSICGPLLQEDLKAIAFEITGDDYTKELKQNMSHKLNQVLQTLKISDSLLKEYALLVYKDAVRVSTLKFPSGIPSQTEDEKLCSLMDLFRLSPEDVVLIHYQFFGKAYQKSLLESMGSTGIIRDEFRDALETLRKRLHLSDTDAHQLLLETIGERFKPMIQLLANELERSMLTQQQLAQKRNKDMGEDVFVNSKTPGSTLGIGSQTNIMSEMMNVIDFYKENLRNATNDFPVTALQLQACDSEMAVALYRQFVVGSFTEQGSNAARYEQEIPIFGGLLGMNPQQQSGISASIAVMIYDNYIQNSLKKKTTLDQQDMMFLAQIQTKLGLSQEKSSELMIESQKKLLFQEAQPLFQNSLQNNIVQQMKAYRLKCNAMGMDMIQDVQLPLDNVQNMFSIELVRGISSGMITPQNTTQLVDLQESYSLSPEQAEQTLFTVLTKQCTKALEEIYTHLMRGREYACVPEIQKLLQYAQFESKLLQNQSILDQNFADKVFIIYDNSIGVKLEKEEAEHNKRLLTEMLGLSPS